MDLLLWDSSHSKLKLQFRNTSGLEHDLGTHWHQNPTTQPAYPAFLLLKWLQFHESLKSSKIFNVLIMKCQFSWDSDGSAFLFHLKVLPLVSFHFEVSSFLTHWCSAGCVLTRTPSPASLAPCLPSSSSFWNWCSSSCVGQEGLCWNVNPSLSLLLFLYKLKI